MAMFSKVSVLRKDLPSAYRQARKDTSKKPQFTGKKPSLLLYSGIGIIALAKDLLDVAFIGSIPGIGTVITVCFNILIFLLFFFDQSGGRRKSNQVFARSLILVCVALVEGIGFGVNFLPLQSLTIATLYILARRTYQKDQKEYVNETQVQSKAERLAEQRERMIERMELEAQQLEAIAAAQEEEQTALEQPKKYI